MRTDDTVVTSKSHPAPEHSGRAPLGSSGNEWRASLLCRRLVLQLVKENKQLLAVKVIVCIELNGLHEYRFFLKFQNCLVEIWFLYLLIKIQGTRYIVCHHHEQLCEYTGMERIEKLCVSVGKADHWDQHPTVLHHQAKYIQNSQS